MPLLHIEKRKDDRKKGKWKWKVKEKEIKKEREKGKSENREVKGKEKYRRDHSGFHKKYRLRSQMKL